ncbi:hypothetical protein AB0I24_15530 [Brachybacterium paraconglomeratum]
MAAETSAPDQHRRATETQVVAGARAMHRAFEMRAERRHNGYYTRRSWEQIGPDCQNEFIDYVRPALEDALAANAPPKSAVREQPVHRGDTARAGKVTIFDRHGDALTLSTGQPSSRTGEVTVHVRERHRGREHTAAVHVEPAELRAALEEVAPSGTTISDHEEPARSAGQSSGSTSRVTAATKAFEYHRVEWFPPDPPNSRKPTYLCIGCGWRAELNGYSDNSSSGLEHRIAAALAATGLPEDEQH